ncbi:ABC transporter permease [Marinifilum fragile]|uniref:ABC transporter permease n=1 Tax=Marinifilum fragile TaxID=570161 RepID=UPI0006CF45E5|nr:ABC transporter permease [Marinifilum fragile]
MFRNYLKTAIRNLRNNITFTLINTIGLSIALAASFIIVLFVINQLSFNQCHKNKESVYRVINHYIDFKSYMTGTPYVLCETIKEEIPQVSKASNLQNTRSFSIQLQDESINTKRVFGCQSDIFDIFSIPILHGYNNGKLLDDLQAICISESMAKKIFSTSNAVGKEVIATINEKEIAFNVVAVFKDLPKNSTFRPNCLINGLNNIPRMNKHFSTEHAESNWDLDFWTTWIKLADGSNQEEVTKQLKEFESKYLKDKGQKAYSLQKLSDVYLNSEHIQSNDLKGNWNSIKIFIAIAIAIILVALINYVILSTAVSSNRSTEIGIRKTFGAANKQVSLQFLTESLILSVMVLPIAILLMILARPYAENLFETSLPIIPGNMVYYLLAYLFLSIFIGFLAGLYTALGLSRLKVVDILKVKIVQGNKKNFVRSSLIILQLIIFCFFVACAFVINAQYQLAISKNPGFHNKNVLLANVRNRELLKPFLNEVRQHSSVIKAGGAASGLPSYSSATMMFPHQQNKEEKVKVEGFFVDFGFLETMGVELKEGRYFKSNNANDTKSACILNETALKAFGIENAIGNKLETYEIIGVVKDFYLHSFHTEVPPLMIVITENYLSQIAIQYHEESKEDLLSYLHASWNKLSPDTKLEVSTVEDLIKQMYASEKNKFTIVSIFAFFTMLIASFGLFGLTLFFARSRTKEIGIRKVLGCSEMDIIYSFVKTNIIFVTIACILSIPITNYAMNIWLKDYALKTDIEWSFYIFTFLIASIVVIITVLTHSYRASKLDPVKSLRYE